MTRRIPTFVLAGIAALALAGAAIAGPRPVAPASPSVFVPTGIFEAPADSVTRVFSNETTNAIVGGLDAARLFCSNVGSAYAVDCLAERLAAVAAEMPATGDYADAREALQVASRKLEKLARDNAAPDLPRANFREQREGGISTTRPLTPVDPARIEEVAAQAEAIVAEAETVLLRSTESSDDRQEHYTRIATAVGSNKVLLRSL